jgi:hypothetical protein
MADLVPKRDRPLWAKHTLTADEIEFRREHGLPIDGKKIEREWRESLERCDAKEREHGAEPEPEEAEPADNAEQLAEDRGYEFTRVPAPPEPAMVHDGLTLKERMMWMRIHALLEKIPGTLEYVYPKFGTRIVQLHMAEKLGAFNRWSAQDKNRIVNAHLERICDLSTFETPLGKWY